MGTARAMWMSMLLALTLPPHLASFSYPGQPPYVPAAWPILLAAGLTLAMLLWVFAGVGSGRLHPVPVVYLLMVVIFQPMLVPHFVLHRQRIFAGDVIDAAPTLPLAPASPRPRSTNAWTVSTEPPSHDALYMEPASQRLMNFTTGRQTPARRRCRWRNCCAMTCRRWRI